MTNLTVIILAALVAIISYIVALVAQYGVPKSISYTDYILKPPFRWVFEGVLTFCGASLIATSTIILGTYINVMAFSGLMFIGVAVFARYSLSKFYKWAHTICAFLGFTAFILTPWLCFGVAIQTAVVAVAVLTVYFIAPKKTKIFWTECAVIVAGFSAIIVTI